MRVLLYASHHCFGLWGAVEEIMEGPNNFLASFLFPLHLVRVGLLEILQPYPAAILLASTAEYTPSASQPFPDLYFYNPLLLLPPCNTPKALYPAQPLSAPYFCTPVLL